MYVMSLYVTAWNTLWLSPNEISFTCLFLLTDKENQDPVLCFKVNFLVLFTDVKKSFLEEGITLWF